MAELNPRQRKFVNEYIKNPIARQAAIKAGYSKKTSEQIACRLLKNVHIRAKIADNAKKIEEKAIVTVEFILNGLLEVAQRCMQRQRVMRFDRAEREMVQETAMVKDPTTGELSEEGVWEFDSAGANRALELLGKYKQMFTENIKHSGTVTLEQLLAGSWEGEK